ncbi:acyl-CoA dehydrogenase family protein [Parasphingorhabdus sp.]|uniref:acyl-CoA dehydrogenase family protein n=1 Tax=Parasphingorhabdus sp. TaxID=2709688 RepID=UPI003A8ED9CD
MNFDLSEEQSMLADAVGKQFETHQADIDASVASIWSDYHMLGLIGLPFSEGVGGFGSGYEEIMIVMETYGRTLGTAPYLQSVLMAGRLLELLGGGTAEYALASLLSGDQRFALCLYEPGERYRWSAPNSSAARLDGRWILTGKKTAVLDADRETTLICPVTTTDGLRLFLVPSNIYGVATDVFPTPDGRTAANIEFDRVSLPYDAEIGDPASNQARLEEVLDGAILACCAEMVGAMEKLLEITVEYLGTRKQFGVAIGSFQVLQHRAADMLVSIEQARSIMIHAASMMSGSAADRHVAVAAAKALVNRSSHFVGSEAIQLHGGMGLASEYAAGRYFQRLTVLENIFGDTDHHMGEVERGGGLTLD